MQLLVKWWAEYPAELLETRVVKPLQKYLTDELYATKKLTIRWGWRRDGSGSRNSRRLCGRRHRGTGGDHPGVLLWAAAASGTRNQGRHAKEPVVPPPRDCLFAHEPNLWRLCSLSPCLTTRSVMNVIKVLAKVEEANQLGRQLPPEAFYNELIRCALGRLAALLLMLQQPQLLSSGLAVRAIAITLRQWQICLPLLLGSRHGAVAS